MDGTGNQPHKDPGDAVDKSVDVDSGDRLRDKTGACFSPTSTSATTASTMMPQGNSLPTLADSYDSHSHPSSGNSFLLPPGAEMQKEILTAKEFYAGPQLQSCASVSFGQTSTSSSRKEDSGSETGSFSLISCLPVLLQEQYLSLPAGKQQEADTVFRDVVDQDETDPAQWFSTFLRDHKRRQKVSPPSTSYGLEFGPSLDRYNVAPISDDLSVDQADLESTPPPGFSDQHQFSFADLPQGYLQGIEDTLLGTPAAEENQAASSSAPVPVFVLQAQQQTTFDSLSSEEKTNAIQFCHEMARTQTSVRNPAAFYSRVFEKFLRSKVPPFQLKSKASEFFQKLSPSQQEKARSYCLTFAKNAVSNGRPIRNPSSYYNDVFQSYRSTHADQLDDPDSALDRPKLQPPEFQLPRNRQEAFQSLPQDQQDVVKEYCINAARSLMSAGHTIHNKVSYYGKVFDSVRDRIPSITASNNNASPDDSSLSSRSQMSVPAFVLQPTTMRTFRLFSKDLQEKATAFCIQQAQTEISNGKPIRTPAAFYSVAFQRFRHRHRNDDESAVPDFIVGDKQRKRLEQLSEPSRSMAIKFCKDAAAAVSETGRRIQKPQNFYNRNLERYFESHNQDAKQPQPLRSVNIPDFILPESPRRVFDALSSSQRDMVLRYCQKSAENTTTHEHTKIEDPATFYAWAFHRFFEDQTSDSTSVDALQDAPGLASSPAKKQAPSPPPVERSLLSADLLQRELNDAKSMLETKTQAFDHVSALLKQEQERSTIALQESSTLRDQLVEHDEILSDLRRERSGLQARCKLLSQTEQRSKSDQSTIASLQDELKTVQDKYNKEAETFRKMTATFATVSDELCRERSARRNVEDELQTERDRVRSMEQKIAALLQDKQQQQP